jgi:hypothetical protein
MTATNHALTGTIIGLLIDKPELALPIAFLSHFVLDALPHYGASDRIGILKTNGFRDYLIIEASLCFIIVVLLAVFQPTHWQQAAVCAFLAASPDFYWVSRYITIKAGGKWKATGFAKFAGGIQWFQKPIGAVVEVAWLLGAIAILIPLFTMAKT